MKPECKRTLGFGALLWVFIFAIISIVMFIPALADKELYQFIILWVLMVPLVMFLAKWYFRVVTPTVKSGLKLGIVAVLVGTVLDVAITVPFFVKSYAVFYSNVYMYIGMLWGIILTTYAGYEFDTTYTKPEDTKE